MAGPDPAMQNPIDKYFMKVTRYHYYFFTLFLLSKFTTVWHTLNIVFISPPMNYTCADTSTAPATTSTPDAPNKTSLRNDNMLNKCPCNNPVWDTSMFTKTVQTRYKILCSDKYLISISESGTFFGVLVGSMVFGLLSDKYGRLTTFAAANLVMGINGCLIAITPNMILFIVVRFFEGFGAGGVIVTGYVFCMEYCGPSYRATMSSVVHVPANLGLVILAGISYLIRDYQHFQIATSIPVILLANVKWCLLDSPKWMLDIDKEKTLKLMKKFCRYNKDPCETLETDIAAYHGSRINLGVKLKFHHIFKYRSHTKNFLCMAYCFFVYGMCYIGVSQLIGKMSTEVHVNTASNGLFSVIGTTCCIFIINRVGRKPFLAMVYFSAGLCIIIVVALPNSMKGSVLSVFLACLSSALFYMTSIISFLFAVELFPTSIRNSTFGMLSVSSRVGQILGPLINVLSSSLAGSVFSAAAILAAVVTVFLPETRGAELPSTLEDTPTSTPIHPDRTQSTDALRITKPNANQKGPGNTPS